MITTYNAFLENIDNKLFISNYHILIDSIDVTKINFSDKPFEFNINNYNDNYTLEQLKNNPKFNKILSNHNLFISEFVNTKDYDTYLLNDIKYILIHKRQNKQMNKLEKLGDPEYIIFQTYQNNEWLKDKIIIYKINNNFSNFYNKLNSKTIEIKYKNKNYIYISNGDNWILKNIENLNSKFKKILSNKELNHILLSDNTQLSIII
jgi:hypothetical protein